MHDVVKNYPRVSDELIRKYAAVDESSSINESLSVNGALPCDFRPVWPEQRMVGRAFTVRAGPSDNLILHKAITMLSPGDVLVAACDGFLEAGGMWGGLMSQAAKTRGAAGLVTDGSVRDTVMMKRISFPVWSRGIGVKSSTKRLGGRINHPITIGGVLVNPGDLVFGDNDGVVAVPREQAEAVLEKALRREAQEEETLKRVMDDGTHIFFSSILHETYAKLGLSEE